MQHLHRYLSFGSVTCLLCGSLIVEKSSCCKICEDKLLRYKNSGRSANQFSLGLKTLSLFDWSPGTSDTLSKYIHLLKAGKNKNAWAWSTREFLKLNYEEVFSKTPTKKILIPAPPRSNQQNDHAYCFAKLLEDNRCGRLLQAFAPREPSTWARAQKHLSRYARVHRQYQHDVILSPDHWQDQSIVFVDDVVTTGSTAKSAYLALGCPRDFEIWCLAKRSTSCG